jgi:hypothetical protein
MDVLLPSQLLSVWERGLPQPPIERALTLLSAALPDLPVDALAQIGIGRRNACLLALREQVLGAQLEGIVVCPHCGERLELALNTADLRPASTDEPEETLALRVDAYQVRFRLPNSLDLIAVSDSATVETARRRLLSRLALHVERDGEDVPPAQLPDRIVAAIAERLSQADPLAAVQLALDCPACRQAWLASLDIAACLWSELNAWAARTLQAVHTLASAYGWREADILALSAARREFYLDRVRG